MGSACGLERNNSPDNEETRKEYKAIRDTMPSITVHVKRDGEEDTDITVKPWEVVYTSLLRELGTTDARLVGGNWIMQKVLFAQLELSQDTTWEEEHIAGGAVVKAVLSKAPPGSLIATLTGHSGTVFCLAALPSGGIVSGAHDGTVKTWSPGAGECLATMTPSTGATGEVRSWVRAIASLPDGSIVSGHGDGAGADAVVRVWRFLEEGWECCNTLEGHTMAITCLAVMPSGDIVSGSKDHNIIVFTRDAVLAFDHDIDHDLQVAGNKQDFTQRTILMGHTGHVQALATLPDTVISGSFDYSVRIWNVDQAECLAMLEGHTDDVHAVAVLPNGDILSGSRDRTIRVWTNSSQELGLGKSLAYNCKNTLKGHEGTVKGLAVLKNGGFVSSSADGCIRMWGPDGACDHVIPNAHGVITSVTALIAPPNGGFVSASGASTIRMWAS